MEKDLKNKKNREEEKRKKKETEGGKNLKKNHKTGGIGEGCAWREVESEKKKGKRRLDPFLPVEKKVGRREPLGGDRWS